MLFIEIKSVGWTQPACTSHICKKALKCLTPSSPPSPAESSRDSMDPASSLLTTGGQGQVWDNWQQGPVCPRSADCMLKSRIPGHSSSSCLPVYNRIYDGQVSSLIPSVVAFSLCLLCALMCRSFSFWNSPCCLFLLLFLVLMFSYLRSPCQMQCREDFLLCFLLGVL